MTRAEEILLKEMRYIASISNGQVKRVAEGALASVSEYLATEPSGERAELIDNLRRIAAGGMADYASTGYPNSSAIRKAADMLEADAREIESLECDYTDQVLRAVVAEEKLAQQAKRVPMTWQEADAAYGKSQDHYDLVRAVENHHEIHATK